LIFERDAEAKVDFLLGPIPRQTVVICKGNGPAPRATLKREGRMATTWTSRASTGKPSAAHDSVRRERAWLWRFTVVSGGKPDRPHQLRREVRRSSS